MNPLGNYRQQFPALANKAYFNYGGQGPLPTAALDAIYQSYHYVQEWGPFSAKINGWVTEEARQTRALIAAELGVAEETITLTEDVTVGCNIALWGMDWQPGDHLLLTDCEHPGIVAGVQELQRRRQIQVTICPLMATLNQGDAATRIAEYLQPNTKLVVLSHILWNTGQVLPLAEMVAVFKNNSKTQHRIRILVDAAQSVGVLPLNLTELGIDFYAFTGHKWWCGPEGLGGLYVHPDITDFYPTFIGWRGININAQGKPIGFKANGQRYEVATSAYPLYAGLRAAIRVHHQMGTAEERYQQMRQLSQYLWERLLELPGVNCLRHQAPEAGLVSFTLTQALTPQGMPHKQLVDDLEKENVMVRLILDPNCIRACVHYFTLKSEIDQLIDGIARTLKMM